VKYSTRRGDLDALATDCLVLPLAAARRAARRLGMTDYLTSATADFKDEPGTVQLVALPGGSKPRRLLIVGTGGAGVSGGDFRKLLNAVGGALKQAALKEAVIDIDAIKVTDFDAYRKTRVALAALSGQLYWYDEMKSKVDGAGRIGRLAVRTDGRSGAAIRRAVRHAKALDEGLRLARDLGNTPPNVCNPAYLARAARRLGGSTDVTVRVVDERQIEKLGMGAFMSVTRGSDTPGKLIVVEYRGGKASAQPVVLIGKGITFDTGGISLKPGAAMDEMKFDMCGAATVLGATRSAIDAKLPLNLVTILAAAENMPSGKASRPGDIVKTLSGQTVEILNTDAEGRLVLCDALTYAERYKPKAVVDVATLTGACIIALGTPASGLFSNDDALAEQLLDAGEFIRDRAWRMPIWDDYQQQLKSNFADMANIGGREAGSITAACFLSRFAKQFPWAHLDVAGSAFSGGANKGASGRPVPLLFEYLLRQA
jgi:leucyl aminopeptidase